MGGLLDSARRFFSGGGGFQTPDVTRTQQLALGQAILAVLVAFGFDLSSDDRQLIIGLATALAAVLPLSDALVRRARAQNAVDIAEARERVGAGAGAVDAKPLARLLGELEVEELRARERLGDAAQRQGRQ